MALALVFALIVVTQAEPPTEQEVEAQVVQSTPVVIDPVGEPAGVTFPTNEALERLALADLEAGRAVLRRAARSAPDPSTRAVALRLLGTHDASTATARICLRALRADIEAGVRRAAAECIGRLGPELGAPETPGLVAALTDGNLDVITMAGWALANVGDASSIGVVAELARHHQDPRVARLFLDYAERMRARLGLVYRPPSAEPATDDEGRRLVPPGYVLISQAHGLDLAASTGWLGLYGGLMGWHHGTFLLSAHGGPTGAQAAALVGLGGAALGAALGSTYAFSRADSLPLAHTVVQLGMAGAFAGFGAGLMSGFPPTSAVSAANLSFAGTLAGTALGIAMVESRPPTLGSLGVGLTAGLTLGTAGGAFARGHGLSEGASIGAALLVGSTASVVGTLATADLDVGLFPVTGAVAGSMLGAGVGAGAVLLTEQGGLSDGAAWSVAGATLAGASAGALVGLLVPRKLDPLLAPELELFPPTIVALPSTKGQETVPGMMIAGRF